MVAVLLHRLADDAFQFDRNLRIQIPRRHRLGCSTASSVTSEFCPGERLFAGGHLVQHHAKRKQVAAGVDRLAAGLLRRHVDGGSRNHAHSGQRVVGASVVFGPEVVHQLRQPEVENLHLSAGGQKDVGGLDVAMDDALGVRRHQRVGHLHPDVEHLSIAIGVAGDVLLQALPLKLLHDDEGVAVVVFNAVDRADIRMVQQRGGPGLARKTFQRLGIAGQDFRG